MATHSSVLAWRIPGTGSLVGYRLWGRTESDTTEVTQQQQQQQMALVVKNSPANAGHLRNLGLIPGSGRSSGGGNGNPLPYSCLENPMYRGAWRATVHGAAKSWTPLKQLSTQHTQWKSKHLKAFLYFQRRIFINPRYCNLKNACFTFNDFRVEKYFLNETLRCKLYENSDYFDYMKTMKPLSPRKGKEKRKKTQL